MSFWNIYPDDDEEPPKPSLGTLVMHYTQLFGDWSHFLSYTNSKQKHVNKKLALKMIYCLWISFNQLWHTIRKVKFLSKNSILTKPQRFHEFFIHFFFWHFFLVKSKLSTVKKPKTTTFSWVFHSKKSTNFSENQSWISGQKMKISNSVSGKSPGFSASLIAKSVSRLGTLIKPLLDL